MCAPKAGTLRSRACPCPDSSRLEPCSRPQLPDLRGSGGEKPASQTRVPRATSGRSTSIVPNSVRAAPGTRAAAWAVASGASGAASCAGAPDAATRLSSRPTSSPPVPAAVTRALRKARAGAHGSTPSPTARGDREQRARGAARARSCLGVVRAPACGVPRSRERRPAFAALRVSSPLVAPPPPPPPPSAAPAACAARRAPVAPRRALGAAPPPRPPPPPTTARAAAGSLSSPLVVRHALLATLLRATRAAFAATSSS